MAVFAWASSNTLIQWAKGYFREWVRGNQFKPYMGKDINKIIQVNKELGKAKGDKIRFRFFRKLAGSGVTGDNTLEGNEDTWANASHEITVDQLRNAVVCGEMEGQKSDIDIQKEVTPALMDWDMEKFRDSIIDALGSANVDGSTKYSSCSEAQKDAWLAANDGTVRRVMFGEALSNQSGTDHSASLANIDGTNDMLDPPLIDLIKRQAKLASPAIRPIRVNDGGEYYVLFVGSYPMRDLRAHATMSAALTSARERGKNNPLFTDGDLMWANVIIHEVPEIDVISGVGAGGIDVAPCYLCGAQAVGVAIAKEPHAIKNDSDYENMNGKGVATIRGVEKLMHDDTGVQHGVLTLYVSGVADS